MICERIRPFLSLGMCLALALVTGGRTAWGEEIERAWSISPMLGVHSPALSGLNRGEFLSPVQGTAQIITETAQGSTNVPTFFEFRNPLPELAPGATAGLEFQWRINERHSILIGLAAWEATSSAIMFGQFPIQGAFERVENFRKGKLSYNELALGWRYDVMRKPKKYNLYLRLSGHEVFDIDQREDSSYLFLSGPAATFRRSFILQSQATGLLLAQAGIGGEWFLNDWLSLGFESAVSVGTRRINLRDGELNTDFRSDDNVFLQFPLVHNQEGNMFFKTEDGAEYHELRLGFEGWKALARINFYY